MSSLAKFFFYLLLIAFISTGVAVFYLAKHETTKQLGPLENIKGIPFPQRDNLTLITEQMAHADVYLNESVLAKQLRLSITFTPLDSASISVGLRENPFWLSYDKKPIYDSTSSNDPAQQIKSEVVIPLTDKLPDRDGSLDLMIFTNEPNLALADTPDQDKTFWLLHNIKAEVEYVRPSLPEIKNFILSNIKREKPI